MAGTRTPARMPYGPYHGYYHAPRSSENARPPCTPVQDSIGFLDDPFRTPFSALLFLVLCAGLGAIVYVLAKRLRRARSYKSNLFTSRRLQNLESARRLPSGVDTGSALMWTGESELNTTDLVDAREGSAIYEDHILGSAWSQHIGGDTNDTRAFGNSINIARWMAHSRELYDQHNEQASSTMSDSDNDADTMVDSNAAEEQKRFKEQRPKQGYHAEKYCCRPCYREWNRTTAEDGFS